MSIPYQFGSSDDIRELTIQRFAGVDFANHPSKVDWARSPDACNMIANEAFFPVKRTGYRRLAAFDAAVYGLHRLDDRLLCHTGNKLYLLSDTAEPQLLYDAMNTEKSVSFSMNGRLWLLDGKTYLVYDGTTVCPVRDIAYIPTTTISSPPAGGGTSLEAINQLTPKRINTFVGDGKSTVFQLDCTDIDLDSVSAEYPIEYVNHFQGQVTFSSAPPDAGGLANVTIQFSKSSNVDYIEQCRIFGMYGGKNDTRVFVSGNPNKPNYDWQSGLYDPTYFPDTGYTRIGTDASEIMGYVRQYDTQVVLKSDGQDARQYLRSFVLDENDKPTYPLRQGAEAAGAISRNAIDTLAGTPYYLSSQGILGIYGTYVTDYRVVSPVSSRIDPRLCRESLADAVACVWNGCYYLAVGGHCYVADSRQLQDNIPEWYYWDNIPASCFLVDRGDSRLLFGTPDGRVCVFCHESDADAYFDDGKPVSAHWSTPFSALDYDGRHKTIFSTQSTLMPYGYSGAEIWYRTEQDYQQVHRIRFAQFSFARLNFERFTFCSMAQSVPVFIPRRVRRTYLFQMIVRNETAGEPFGLLGLLIRYRVRTNIRNI